MIEIIYILCVIIIIKSEVWSITHCLGLGHETMVCAVYVFLYSHEGCAVHNDHWPLHISASSFIYEFELLKYGTYFRVRLKGHPVLNGIFPYFSYMITTIGVCVLPWPIYSRSSSCDFAIKCLKYGLSCCVRSTAHVFRYYLWMWINVNCLYRYPKPMGTGGGCLDGSSLCWVLSGWGLSGWNKPVIVKMMQ